MTEQQKSRSVAICTHVFSDVDFDIYFNHMYCVAHWSRGFDLVFVGKSGLTAASARNRIIERAIEKNCTHALFLDGDHLVPVETLPLLMESGDEAMVSGVVCKKGERFQQVCWQVKENTAGKKEYYHMVLPLDGRLYEVSVCAFGCTLINLEKLQKLKKPYFRDTCEEKFEGELCNVRSDINICTMFKDIGEKSWVDTRVLVGHLGVPSIVYPQSAEFFGNLREIEGELSKLKEGQVGHYFYPGEDR